MSKEPVTITVDLDDERSIRDHDEWVMPVRIGATVAP